MGTMVKVIKEGDTLRFDMTECAPDCKHISITLVEKAGRAAVLRIEADRVIPIAHEKKYRENILTSGIHEFKD
jgi:hypothetical protein